MDTAARARQLALAGIEVRATTADAGGSGGKTAHEPAGSPKGGQFASRPGNGSKATNHRRPKKAAPAQNLPKAPAKPRLVKEGDSGEDVRYAQYAMSLLGFKVAQDGRFGPETAAAVKQMQQRLGMKHPNGHITPALLHKMQDAVRLSPCVGQGQRDLSFEAQWEQRDEDDELDETAEAVLDALDEFERSTEGEWDERGGHDVSKELRIPSGKGGGRWTKNPITSAIAHALEEWSKGNGPDDPFTFDGKPIDREPLRKAAVARGISLKRGATREDIVAALKDDVKATVREAKAAKSPEVGKPVRFTLTGGGAMAGGAPVTVRLRGGANSDPSTWSAKSIEGVFSGSQSDALSAVTTYVRRPGFVNTRLRTPVPDTTPGGWSTWLHEGSIDEMLGRAPFDEAAEAAARARADGMIAALDGLMGPTDRKTVYRGASIADIGLPASGHAVGYTWTDSGYVSTAADRNVAAGSFGGGPGRVTLDIRPQQGTPSLRIEGLGETEVLLGRGLTYRVVEDSRQPGSDTGRVVVEAVPKPASKLRDLDVGVYSEGKKVSLWEVTDSGQKRRRVALVDDLAGLQAWADEHGESELAGWARKERGGAEAPATKSVGPDAGPVEGAKALAAAPASLVTGRGLTTTQKSALRNYQQQGAHDRINTALRQGRDVSKLAQVARIDEALAGSKLTDDVVVYRGVPGRTTFGDSWSKDLTNFEWTDPAYLSTSAQKAWATGFGHGGSTDDEGATVLRIVAPQGTPAIQISRFEQSNGLPDEAELLMARGLRLRVVADRREQQGKNLLGIQLPPHRVLDVEVVPHDTPAKAAPVKKATKAAPTAVPDLDSLRTLDTEARRDALDLRKVDELKAMLRESKLPVSGKKRDLVDRLVSHLDGGGKPAAKGGDANAPTQGPSLRERLQGYYQVDLMKLAGVTDVALDQPIKRRGPVLTAKDLRPVDPEDPAPFGRRLRTRDELAREIAKAADADPAVKARVMAELDQLGAPRPKRASPTGPGAVRQGKFDNPAVPARAGTSDSPIRWAEGQDPGWDEARTKRARSALRAYGQASFEINESLRGQPVEDPIFPVEQTAAHIAAIDDLMAASRTTAPMEQWRGLRDARGMFGDRLDGDLTGAEWREDAFVSTSSDMRVSQYFATFGGDGMLMRVIVPTGTGAAQVKDVRGEAEALLQRGLKLRIVADHGVQPGWGYRLVDVEVVPADGP